MKQLSTTAVFLLAALLQAVSASAVAMTPEERGLQLAQQVDARNNGFGDSIVDLTMTLKNEAGDTTVRTLSMKRLEVANDGDRTITLFDSPRDVKGTALLTWSHTLDDDEQWLYLPSISRVKRISSKNKSGPFMGSEYAFEDLSSPEVDKFTYYYLKEDTLNGVDVHVSQRTPTYRNSGYSRQVVWIDRANLNMLKTEYYDRGNNLLKTLVASEHRQYPNGQWRAHKFVMTNHQNNKESTLTWQNYTFNNRLAASQFTKNRIKRAR